MTNDPATPKKYYICGPMRGKKDFNRREFSRVAVLLSQRGLTVRSPSFTEDLLDSYYDLRVRDKQKSFSRDDLRDIIMIDLMALSTCDAIILLEGWEKSYGATVEVSLAQFLGLEVYTLNEENLRKGDWVILDLVSLKDRPFDHLINLLHTPDILTNEGPAIDDSTA